MQAGLNRSSLAIRRNRLNVETTSFLKARLERIVMFTRLSSIKVTARPKSGSARAGAASIVYTAKPGFKGSDSFAVAVTGQGATGTPGTANISVSVNVQ
jgi:hypothetical protein